MPKKIKILKNGPYEVTPDVPLRQMTIQTDDKGDSRAWEEGKTYPQGGESYHLCRCGHSKNKPYCDGSHAAHHFSGDEVASKLPYDEQAVRYRGDTVDLLDQESLCAVARFCDRGETAWTYAVASSQPGFEEIAIHQCNCCPSGRLTIQRKDGTKVEPELPQDIGLVQDPSAGHRGPLWVRGGIPVEGADGTMYEVRNRMTLCRCGESSNMPFCDASHLNCEHMQGNDA